MTTKKRKTNRIKTKNVCKEVFILVETSLEDCGATVFTKRDKLLETAKGEYGLTNDELECLDMEGRLDLGESTLFLVNGVPIL